jgi:glutathione S-transferase
MDWLLASINAPYLALFRDAKKKPEERAPMGRAVQDDDRAVAILDAHPASANGLRSTGSPSATSRLRR